MSLFIFYDETNFQDETAKILTELPNGAVTTEDLFGFPITRTTTVELDADTTLIVQYNVLNDTTQYVAYDSDTAAIEYQFLFPGEVDTVAGLTSPDLRAYLASTEPDFISFDPLSVIRGFATRDEMLGEARFFGGGNDDKIELESQEGTLGSATDGSAAFGQGGNDILKAAVQLALLNGGSGDDTLVGEFGTMQMTGGTGADAFIFDNGFWDSGTPVQAAAGTTATITDFDTLEGDVLVFAQIDDAATRGDPVARTSLEDLYGAGTLDTLADFTLDGLSYGFSEAGGDTVITRSGTDGAGRSYDETVTLDGVALADIDRGDVYLQDYAADTYEYF